MRVLFRADASVEIGTGHIMRCATLADALRQAGAAVVFACRALPGDLRAWLSEQGYPVLTLPDDLADNTSLSAGTGIDGSDVTNAKTALPHSDFLYDWLVVDHYGLDARWETAMRAQARKILVIDDLANRPHDCDVLLDQNVTAPTVSPYTGLVPANCQQLLGPSFALLRPAFAALRADSCERVSPCGLKDTDSAACITRLLIFFGGSDPTQECFKALNALRLLRTMEPLPDWLSGLQVDLIAGGSNPRFEALQTKCLGMPNLQLHRQVQDMAAMMQQADLCLGAGGTTTWERCCLGLPGVVIAVADNQVVITQNVAALGAQRYLGESAKVTASDIASALQSLLGDAESASVLAGLRQAGMALVDGLGVQRVVAVMRPVLAGA